MEAPPRQSSDAGPGTAVGRRASGRQNKVQRIGSQARGLFDDFTSWVELRLRLFQIELQERVRTKLNEAAVKAAPIVAAALAGLFTLVTIALFVGWALGHPAWGFLVVTALLFLITGILYERSRRLDSDAREVDVTDSSADGMDSSGRASQ